MTRQPRGSAVTMQSVPVPVLVPVPVPVPVPSSGRAPGFVCRVLNGSMWLSIAQKKAAHVAYDASNAATTSCSVSLAMNAIVGNVTSRCVVEVWYLF